MAGSIISFDIVLLLPPATVPATGRVFFCFFFFFFMGGGEESVFVFVVAVDLRCIVDVWR